MGSHPLRLTVVLVPVTAPRAAQHRRGGFHSGGHSRLSHPHSDSRGPKTQTTHARADPEHRSRAEARLSRGDAFRSP